MMTKQQVKQALDIKTDAALAQVFGICRAAVGLWKADKPIPELREYQLRDRFPTIFGREA